ncbi:hypothetical protein DUI87_19930 [Hirundo rustica rustica]|uniref:Uncharacterized protein n=1 Tax=Hirundo rustica rustica TaxID=333673 RepID=A0A3M0JVG7_HIRRU|nr:hypothetical protein DUI87_19930 [Hirundo rustica rustica]
MAYLAELNVKPEDCNALVVGTLILKILMNLEGVLRLGMTEEKKHNGNRKIRALRPILEQLEELVPSPRKLIPSPRKLVSEVLMEFDDLQEM